MKRVLFLLALLTILLVVSCAKPEPPSCKQEQEVQR